MPSRAISSEVIEVIGLVAVVLGEMMRVPVTWTSVSSSSSSSSPAGACPAATSVENPVRTAAPQRAIADARTNSAHAGCLEIIGPPKIDLLLISLSRRESS